MSGDGHLHTQGPWCALGKHLHTSLPKLAYRFSLNISIQRSVPQQSPLHFLVQNCFLKNIVEELHYFLLKSLSQFTIKYILVLLFVSCHSENSTLFLFFFLFLLPGLVRYLAQNQAPVFAILQDKTHWLINS